MGSTRQQGHVVVTGETSPEEKTKHTETRTRAHTPETYSHTPHSARSHALVRHGEACRVVSSVSPLPARPPACHGRCRPVRLLPVPCRLLYQILGGVLRSEEGLVRRPKTEPLGAEAVAVVLIGGQAGQVASKPEIDHLIDDSLMDNPFLVCLCRAWPGGASSAWSVGWPTPLVPPLPAAEG